MTYLLRTSVCLVLLLLSHLAKSQSVFQLKVSKPYCVLEFMRAATGWRSTSPTYRDYILEHTRQNADFQRICEVFKSLNLDYNYQWQQLPDTRRQYRSTYDLIIIQAVGQPDLPAMSQAIMGTLPLADHQKLMSVLTQAEGVYDDIIWKPYKKKMLRQQRALKQYARQAEQLFMRYNQFYSSSWTHQVPFQVALYPIPGRKGVTTATPHANSLCVGVLTDERDYAGRTGVILHEMCHVLYDEQPAAVQHQVARWFSQSKSPYAAHAYSFFDEGMATALGNGYGYYAITAQMDTTEWYNNTYINGYAKALFPLCKQYLEEGKNLDSAFVEQAVGLFGNTFPKSPTDYGILMNRINLYADTTADDILQVLHQSFNLYGYQMSVPTTDPISTEALKSSSGTQLIFIDREQEKNLNHLKEIFPALQPVRWSGKAEEYSFFDEKQRPVFVLMANHLDDFALLVGQMKERQYFDPNQLRQH